MRRVKQIARKRLWGAFLEIAFFEILLIRQGVHNVEKSLTCACIADPLEQMQGFTVSDNDEEDEEDDEEEDDEDEEDEEQDKTTE